MMINGQKLFLQLAIIPTFLKKSHIERFIVQLKPNANHYPEMVNYPIVMF